jgi:hypothetical protein
MSSAFELRATPAFRDVAGRFAASTDEMRVDSANMVADQAARFVALAGAEAPGGLGHTVANQVTSEVFGSGSTFGFRIRLGQVAEWQATGTGLYGPAGHVIVPLRAKALHFTWHGQEFFRKFVAGVRPNDFIGRAYDLWLPGARADLRKLARRFIQNFKGQATSVTP